MDYYSLYAVLVAVQTCSITFHMGGLYLLRCLNKSGRGGDIQLMLVGNLSATEVLLNLTYVILFSCNLVTHKVESSGTQVWDAVQLLSGSTLKFVYYATMVYLTVNKLLEVVLNISYPNHCTKRRGKILLAATWALGFSFFITMCVLLNTSPSHSYDQIMPLQNTTTQSVNNTHVDTDDPPLKRQPHRREKFSYIQSYHKQYIRTAFTAFIEMLIKLVTSYLVMTS